MCCSQGRSTQYSYYCYFYTELCAVLRAGVLNIHITVIFTVLCAALRAGVLNIHITVIFLLNYMLLSGQEYSILI